VGVVALRLELSLADFIAKHREGMTELKEASPGM
jgi:hypothetical protein